MSGLRYDLSRDCEVVSLKLWIDQDPPFTAETARKQLPYNPDSLKASSEAI